MTWSDFIVPAAGAICGAAASYFALDKRQAVSEARLTGRLDAVDKTLTEIKAEHTRSAADQGTRIGDSETLIDGLVKWRAEQKAIAEERRRVRADTRGIPIHEE